MPCLAARQPRSRFRKVSEGLTHCVHQSSASSVSSVFSGEKVETGFRGASLLARACLWLRPGEANSDARLALPATRSPRFWCEVPARDEQPGEQSAECREDWRLRRRPTDRYDSPQFSCEELPPKCSCELTKGEGRLTPLLVSTLLGSFFLLTSSSS